MMAAFSSSSAFGQQAPRRTSQQDRIAQQLAEQLLHQGSSTGPVQSPLEGISRALQGVVGGYVAKQGQDRRDKREGSYNATLARALAANTGKPAESVGGIDWQAQPGSRELMTQILGGNPDTAGLGLQLQLGQQDADRARQQGREDYLYEQQNKAPGAPKTVNVDGQVRILNPDGSLGSTLGAQNQYLPVPGVGVFEPGKGTFVGQGQGGPSPSGLPAPPGDPTRDLAPAVRPAAQADELKTSLATIQKDRESLSETLKIAEAATRFGELLDVQNTGGVLRNLPGAQSVEGAFDPEIKEMASLIDKITPLMRQGLPGAASERDTAMFRGAAFGTDKDKQTNRNLILGFQTSAKIAQDRIAFKEAFVSQNGSLRGSETAWKEYLEANPIFDPNSSVQSPQINPKRQSWQEFFGGVRPPELTGFKVRKIK